MPSRSHHFSTLRSAPATNWAWIGAGTAERERRAAGATVRGRQTGRARTVAIDEHDVDGRRYLIATHGVGAWVLNLRAAGEGTLRLGRKRTAFVARELAPEEAGAVMRAALGPLVASSGWRSDGLWNNLRVDRGATDADYAASARDHPVFEVQPTPSH